MGQVLAKICEFFAHIISRLSSEGANTRSNLGDTSCRTYEDHETSLTEQLLPTSESKSNAIVEEKELSITIPDAHIVRNQVIETFQNSLIITILKEDEDCETSATDQLDEIVEKKELVITIPAAHIVSSSHGIHHVIPQDTPKKNGKWIKHYCSSHKILLVGEGDFSFSACLAKAFGSANNMVATSLDSLDFLIENYPSVSTNISYLKNRGCTVIHNVDATTMADHVLLEYLKFDRIIYNFPLAGFFNKSQKQQLKRNRNLVRLFMENAKVMIEMDGEVHITHKTSAFYREWNLENLAKQNRLRLIEDVEFKLRHYPGYNNKYGFGGNENFNCYPSRTYKFGPK